MNNFMCKVKNNQDDYIQKTANRAKTPWFWQDPVELEEVYQKRAARWTTSGANGGFPSSSSLDSKTVLRRFGFWIPKSAWQWEVGEDVDKNWKNCWYRETFTETHVTGKWIALSTASFYLLGALHFYSLWALLCRCQLCMFSDSASPRD